MKWWQQLFGGLRPAPPAGLVYTEDRLARAARELAEKQRLNALWERLSLQEVSKDGRQPDAMLRCMLQHAGDGQHAEYDDCIVATFREPNFLRIVMRDYIDEYAENEVQLHSWDVPYSDLVAVFLRERTDPGYPLEKQDARGSWYWRKPYYQARIYRVRRGIECRLLHPSNPDSTEPYDWLCRNLHDDAIRFALDSQDDPLYGDGTTYRDCMDEYAHDLSDRSETRQDAEDAARAKSLRPEGLRELLSSAPEGIRAYIDSGRYAEHRNRWIRRVGIDSSVPFAKDYISHAERTGELVLAQVLTRRYYQIAYYDYFHECRVRSSPEAEKLKGELLDGLRGMMNMVGPDLR